jgi:hypothetical protein
MRRRIAICSALFLLFPLSLLAPVNPVLVGGMKWRQIGPFRGGRVLAVAGVPGDPNTYYFGAVAGGIFKSTNGGLSWTPTFDHQDISSIGAIAVADSNPNVLYAGTGEACLRGNISYGDGVYKSTDAGKTWMNVGLKDTRHIGAVIIDPAIPISFWWLLWAMPGGRIPNVVFFARPMAAKPGRGFSTKTRTLEPSMSSSIPRTPALFTRHSGKCAGSRGTSTAAVPVVGSIGLLMAA